uniref:RRM domain-containing protein n=1 Tax=Chlorocebus sabaeus TaxID=60711 RepID=A0A0D9RXC7_CHLSB
MVAFSDLAGPILSLNLQEDAKFQKDMAQVHKHIAWENKQEQLIPGVVYVHHLPNLLNETQILFYFSQCGTVTRFRLSRKKRTGNSKGYASVECESEDIAKIVAEMMNNYLFGERLSECHFMPPEKVKELFKDCDIPFKQPSYPSVKYNQNRHLQKSCRWRGDLKERKITQEEISKGIHYDFPPLILQKMESISKTNRQMSTKGQEEEVLGTPDSPEKTADTQGPTPVCTSMFLERGKSEVAVMNNDDEDNERVFKKPISCVKEKIQETQTPTHSQKKR